MPDTITFTQGSWVGTNGGKRFSCEIGGNEVSGTYAENPKSPFGGKITGIVEILGAQFNVSAYPPRWDVGIQGELTQITK